MQKQIVRILDYPKDHINGYARVDAVDKDTGIVYVTNLNMPFQGTFAGKPIPISKVEFLED